MLVKCEQLQFLSGTFEPFFCSATLYDIAKKTRLSETWNFECNEEINLSLLSGSVVRSISHYFTLIDLASYEIQIFNFVLKWIPLNFIGTRPNHISPFRVVSCNHTILGYSFGSSRGESPSWGRIRLIY